MMRARLSLVALICCVLALPLVTTAQQTDEEILRAEIRAALMQDPRSSELSESEFSLLVDALAQETVDQGLMADFVPPAVTFTSGEGGGGYSFYGYTVSEPLLYGIVLLGLAVGMITIRFALDHHSEVPIQTS